MTARESAPAAKRGRGRPSNAEKARRAAELALAVAAAPATSPASDEAVRAFIAQAMSIPTPPEPSERPILPPAPPPVTPPPAQQPEQDLSLLASHERENPDRLYGSALRHFAWQRGLSRSEMEGWSDEKVREQVQIVIRRQYNDQAYAEA